MDRDLKILDQARTIERLSKENAILHTLHNPQGRVETIDCDPYTCEHAKENVNLKRTIERLNQEIAILRGSTKPNHTEPTQDPNLSVLHTCDPDTCKHAIENKDKSRRLAYYENAHSPSSKNNLPTQQAKRDKRKDPSEYKTPGAKIGHKGTSEISQILIIFRISQHYQRYYLLIKLFHYYPTLHRLKKNLLVLYTRYSKQ